VSGTQITVWCCFRDALTTTLSALYGKLLVVMGIAFPMAEVISTYIPPSFYEVSEVQLQTDTSHYLLQVQFLPNNNVFQAKMPTKVI
jgi:hypothetical protein